MKLIEFANQLAQPEACREERLSIAAQLLMLFDGQKVQTLTEEDQGCNVTSTYACTCSPMILLS